MSAIEAMSSRELWVHILVFAIVTYALRLSFIAVFSYQDMPDQIRENLRLVPPAILAAMVVPPLVYRDGTFHLSPTNPFILAGIAAGIVAWKSESLIGTITAG
jgi:branched-subunit amino acid transport protein